MAQQDSQSNKNMDTTREQGRQGQKDLGRDTDSRIGSSQSTGTSQNQGQDKKQSGNR